MNLVQQSENFWVRSDRGVFAGICHEIGQRTKTDPLLIRLIWLFSLFFFGTGLLVYIYLWLALPRRDELSTALDRKILGVCANIAKRSGHEVGLVRLAALVIATVTFGMTFLVYMMIWALGLLKDEDFSQSQTRSQI